MTASSSNGKNNIIIVPKKTMAINERHHPSVDHAQSHRALFFSPLSCGFSTNSNKYLHQQNSPNPPHPLRPEETIPRVLILILQTSHSQIRLNYFTCLCTTPGSEFKTFDRAGELTPFDLSPKWITSVA